MFKRQTNGSCICVFCNQLISVNKPTCPHCGRKNPSLCGYSRIVRRLGSDLGFTAIVTRGCIALYLATLLSDLGNIDYDIKSLKLLIPSNQSLLQFGASGAASSGTLLYLCLRLCKGTYGTQHPSVYHTPSLG